MNKFLIIIASILSISFSANAICVGSIESAFALESKGIKASKIVVNYDGTVTFLNIRLIERGEETLPAADEAQRICNKIYDSSAAHLVHFETRETPNKFRPDMMDERKDLTCSGVMPENVCPGF